MSLQNFNILFVIAQNRVRQDNKAPLFCRITYQKKRKQFATGIFIFNKNWDSKQQKTKPPNEENNFINTQISLIKQQINQAFLFLQIQSNDFNVEDIYFQYLGESPKKEKLIIELFEEHNDKMEKLIGKDYVKATLWKFRQAKELLKDFIKSQYQRNDYQFTKLDLKFIQDYEFYLKTEKNLGQTTVNKMIQRFRKIIKIAISEDYITSDPFLFYKVKRIKNEIVYLTTEELSKLENYTFSQTRLQQVADMFIFCCYTGLAYQEMDILKSNHIIQGFDGNLWIKMIREKTQREISIPLLNKAIKILNKYQEKITNDYLLPKISNQKFNSYLKEIADIVGIHKNLTHHIARKTFATTVLLYNDVPMEIVSELLGHSKITITQEHYAKVVQKKVSKEIKNLQKKLV